MWEVLALPPRSSCLECVSATGRGRSQAQLDAEYSPSRVAPESQAILWEYRRLSEVAKQTLRCELRVRYGDSESELLHHFPPRRASSPLLVYVHGGHWQEQSIDDSCFAANALIEHGAGFLAVGYGLAPACSLGAMVTSIGRALEWVSANAVALGGTPQQIYAAGSSAGAHLLAMALGGGSPTPCVKVAGLSLLSGVYELSRIRRSYVNDKLQLTDAEARQNSPVHHLPLRAAEVLVARGEIETAEYVRQHDLLITCLRGAGGVAAGAPVVWSLVCRGRNHFDLPLGLGQPQDELGCAVLRQMRLGSRAR
jgi:arylformamidase